MELTVQNLSKTYANGVQALRDVSLRIGPGMFGLLGPNGAGKSTLMRTIATLQEPDSGEVRFGDLDISAEKQRLRRVLGYLPQEFGVYPRTSAVDLLDHFARLKGLIDARNRRHTVDRILVLTNLYADRKRALGSFSGGMKQLFGIAQAMLGDPSLLIVDEPTAGLDPEERARFHNVLSEIGEERVVILSTHIVSDISDLCTDMAVIHEGRVMFHGKPEQAQALLSGRIWRRSISRDAVESCRKKFRVVSTNLRAGKIQMRVYGDTLPEKGFDSATPTIKDVYFSTIRGYLEGAA